MCVRSSKALENSDVYRNDIIVRFKDNTTYIEAIASIYG